jgi:hypothetical protein
MNYVDVALQGKTCKNCRFASTVGHKGIMCAKVDMPNWKGRLNGWGWIAEDETCYRHEAPRATW